MAATHIPGHGPFRSAPPDIILPPDGRRHVGSHAGTGRLARRPTPPAPGPTRDVPPRRTFPLDRAASAITVDGVLDEKAWEGATMIEVSYEYFPGDNVEPPVRTECRVTFDDANVYLGFTAFDPRPEEIRAHLADRDSITTFQQDDHVGFQFDSFNDERRSFQFRVNPLGVQADALFSEVDGIEDWAWGRDLAKRRPHHSGRLRGGGAAVPFHQLRFPKSRRPRDPRLDLFRPTPAAYATASRPTTSIGTAAASSARSTRYRASIPSLRGATSSSTPPPPPAGPTGATRRGGAFHKADQGAEAGLSAKWGITSNLVLNATVNPDFSQVEADVAQLAVNTRFALFYDEKRPFFLEGADFFATPLQTVYTRTVADPRGGVKLTRKAGRDALGVFVARDAVNNLILPGNQGSDYVSLEERVWSGVARYRRDLGQASTIGVIYAGREGDRYHNRLYGLDAFVRLSSADTVRAQYTRVRHPLPRRRGGGARSEGGPVRRRRLLRRLQPPEPGLDLVRPGPGHRPGLPGG